MSGWIPIFGLFRTKTTRSLALKKVTEKHADVSMEIPAITIGIDLGDRYSEVVAVDAKGEEVRCERITTRSKALQKFFASYAGARVVLEVGPHSPWISRLLEGLGCEVIVSQPA